MEKLSYIIGTMGSGKTTKVLLHKHNLMDRGHNVLLLKPTIDVRDGEGMLKSRIPGLESPILMYSERDSLIKSFSYQLLTATSVIVDECHFSSPSQIEELKYIVDILKKAVFAYGLRTNFQGHLFSGSKRLFELADDISLIDSKCHCGRDTIINARYNEGGIVYDGPEILIGGDDDYIGLCYQCWLEGNLGKKKVKR